MELQTILSAITNVGYPIVMTLILMYYIKYITDSHKEETAKLSESLAENTLVLQTILSKLNEKEEN